jgi:hypothetical protein
LKGLLSVCVSMKMVDVMEEWRWGNVEGYECMIGVFLVSDFGMIYRYLMHRI